MRSPTSLALVLALTLVTSARGDDAPAERAVGLPGTLGLTGFQDMVDARTPKTLSIRAGARYTAFVQDRDFRGAIRASRDDERHEFILYGGVSALGLIDASARLPYTYIRGDTDLHGLVETIHARYDAGWDDLDVAGKVNLDLGPIKLAPFLFGRLPIGEPQVRDLGRFEYGAAATLSLLSERLGIHANVVGVTEEKGLNALRYRAGVSVVPWADASLTVRVYAYGDGIEYEGTPDSDFDLDFGVQAIVGSFLTLELGTTTRLIDANFIARDLKTELGRETIVERHIHDNGTWGVTVGVGVLF